MVFKIKCESCSETGECCIHLRGDTVETIILPKGWRSIYREPGGMHTHDALTFQCPRCEDREVCGHGAFRVNCHKCRLAHDEPTPRTW
jgi:ribosomal protein S27E